MTKEEARPPDSMQWASNWHTLSVASEGDKDFWVTLESKSEDGCHYSIESDETFKTRKQAMRRVAQLLKKHSI